MPRQPIADAELWYDEYGDDDAPEVIISSAMGFAGEGYPERLADGPANYKVYTVQARGFGRSTRPQEPPRQGWLGQWADDVIAFADARGINRFIYTGASHGAGIGWYIAMRRPERLKAFVSVVGAPHDRYGVTDSSEGRRKVIEARLNGDTGAVRSQLETLGGWLHDDETKRRAQRDALLDGAVAATMTRDDDESQINQGMPFPEAKTNDEVADVLRNVRVPTLMLAGMRDGIVSPQASLRAAMSVRDAKAVFFESEGHFMTQEIPERLIREVTLFINEINGTAEPLPRPSRARTKVDTI
ncbi:alpha/beta fold hydrolase [Paramicrobacterium fandaimingii]|uniref:alpha/beta fold hydrolase n=1 Tax=Paramicrobacterium fandaimingii TaxID=2708079 RepID=UPI001AB05F28|nr:alpha/beta hydrolase [Microbacterium fandaimingii]